MIKKPRNGILISRVLSSKALNFKVYVYFLLSIFFISGCKSSSHNDLFEPCEKKRFEEFFKKILFFEQGVYTLYGSKPITEIVLSPLSPEEKMRIQNEKMKVLSNDELAQLKAVSFEYEEEYWFEETWSMWEEKLRFLPIKRYLFAERKIGIPKELKINRYIYFVNIKEASIVLQEYYHLFRDYVGFDFDPLTTVFEIQNPDSPFWNAIWSEKITDKSVCLNGILFGYGLENSYPFSFYFSQHKNPVEIAFINSMLKTGAPTCPIFELQQFNPPKHFSLPAYVSFGEYDPHKEKYLRERDHIKKIYSNADIIHCTLKQLLN